jgi:hypothetical protein
MDMEYIPQAEPQENDDSQPVDSWSVILELAAKTIKFQLSVAECRERRTISWLNNPTVTHLTEEYVPLYRGFRQLQNADIIVNDHEILSYTTYYLDMNEIIFASDEFQKMSNADQAQAINKKRVTPDGIEIITRSVAGNIYHINGHVYKFNATLGQNQFIPMTNVLVRKLDDFSPDAETAVTKFYPFLALNRNYIEGFSMLFRGSKGV